MGVEVSFSFMEVRHTYKNDGTLVYTNARNICTFDASKYENDYLEGLFTKKVDYDFYINETTYTADKYGAALMACTDIDAFVENYAPRGFILIARNHHRNLQVNLSA